MQEKTNLSKHPNEHQHLKKDHYDNDLRIRADKLAS